MKPKNLIPNKKKRERIKGYIKLASAGYASDLTNPKQSKDSPIPRSKSKTKKCYNLGKNVFFQKKKQLRIKFPWKWKGRTEGDGARITRLG